MAVVRLEELLRVLGIAAISAFAGTAVFAGLAFFGTDAQADAGSAIFMFVFFSAIVWVYTFIPSLLCGIALHIVLRNWRLPRFVLLLLFVAVAIPVLYVFYPREPYGESIALASAATAWLAYCFGPLALWRYQFDEFSDVDF